MKLSHRILCLLLAALMVLPLLAGCANDTEPGDTVAESTTETVEEESADLTDNLPTDLNYNEDEIVILSRDIEGWTSGEISVEALNSDTVNDAVYERNLKVESRLNVKINNVLETASDYQTVLNRVTLSVKSGQHEYDIFAGPCNVTLPETLNNTFSDLGGLEYLDLDQPWWSQGFNDAVEYEGARYAITGSAVLTMYRFAFVTIFNKDIFTAANLNFLYDDVINGKWTLDRQMELIPLLYQDNGNSKQDMEGDVYGFVTNNHLSIDPYWSACKVDVIQKNTDGEYEVVFDINHLHDVTDKLLQLYHGFDGAVYTFNNESNDGEQAKIRGLFADGYAAMATVRLLELEAGEIRNMEDQFGVVPMPKYDEQQDDYYTLLHNQFTILCIPNTIESSRLDEMGAFMEALSFESYKTVKPAYYESTLRQKLMQDPESAQMLDIVTSHVRIDVGLLYAAFFDSFHGTYRDLIRSKNNTVSSTYRSLAQRLNHKFLPELLKKLDAML